MKTDEAADPPGPLVAAPTTPPALLVSIQQATSMMGISLRHMVTLLDRGDIRSVRIGRRRLVPVAALNEYIDRQSA